MTTTKSIARVLHFAAADAGHAVELADATRERLRCAEHVAPSLVQALTQASLLAEKERTSGVPQTALAGMAYPPPM